MISDLITAARLARTASVKTAAGFDRLIEILITELGFVVRGQSVKGELVLGASEELLWREFDHNPPLLANSVRLIFQRLKAGEDKA